MSVAPTVASVLSNVHRGRAFEKRSLALLENSLSMSLRRVGGRSDGGVDLEGWWWLPPLPTTSNSSAQSGYTGVSNGVEGRRRIRVLAQCKAEKNKVGPKYVRELEGVLSRHSFGVAPPAIPQQPHTPVVALLLSQSAFTMAAVTCAFSSHLPFMLLRLSEQDPSRDGSDVEELSGIVCNRALLGEEGILGAEYEARTEIDGNGNAMPTLWWNGARLKSWVPDEWRHYSRET